MSFLISFDKKIKVNHACKSVEDKNFLYLYDGWVSEYPIEQVVQENFDLLTTCNGEFYAVRIDKNNQKIKIINDRLGSYMIFYSGFDKIISTELKHFTKNINLKWFAHVIGENTIKNFVKTELDYKSFNRPSTVVDNEYALQNVKYIPVGSILFYDNHQLTLEFYFDTHSDFFNITPIYDTEEELTSFVKNRLANNLKRIMEQYPSTPVLCGGTGLDSMSIIQLLLEQKKEFSVLNYFFKESEESYACHQNFLKLAQFLQNLKINCRSQEYNTTLFLSLIIKNSKMINHFNNNADILYDVITVNENCQKDALVLKGTWGDECLWHLEHPLMLYHKSKGKTYKEAKALCRQTYAYMGDNNPIGFSEEQWNFCNNGWIKDSSAYFYYKRPRYITSERTYAQDKNIFSPFADTALTNLPLKCKNEKLALLCIDGTIQKNIMGDSLKTFLNVRKDGEQEIKNKAWQVLDLNFKKFLLPGFFKLTVQTKKKLTFDNVINFEFFQLYVYMILFYNLSTTDTDI
jgi:asparagine synthetase B (glutamine-hydrolysing)